MNYIPYLKQLDSRNLWKVTIEFDEIWKLDVYKVCWDRFCIMCKFQER